MISKSWWQRTQRFLIGTLIVFLLQAGQSLSEQWLGRQQEMSASTCRVVQHQFQETCIPHHPQRIIAMDEDSLEVLVALGLKPIATVIPNRAGSKLSLLQDKIGSVTNLGRESQPNLERIVQLKPDLILGMSISPQMYSLFSRIAPTVSVEYVHTGWKKTFQQIADIVDRSSTANEVLAAYQQRLEAVRSQLRSKHQNTTVCIMRFYTDAHFTQFFNQNSFAVSVLEDLGVVSIPAVQRRQRQIPNTDYGYFNTSLEQIDLLEADFMFIAVDPGAESSLQLYADSPLWQTLRVVQQKRVYIVPSGHWVFGNILAAHAILDDVSRYLSQEASRSTHFSHASPT